MHDELTEKQLQAIEMLTSGQKLHCIAEAVGVDLATLWRWRQKPEFKEAHQAALDVRQEALREQMNDVMRLTLVALTRVLRGAEEPNGWVPWDRAVAVAKLFSFKDLFKFPATP